MTPIFLKQLANVHNVEVEHHDRELGHSGFRFREGAHPVWNNFLHSTTLPLRLLSQFGILCSLVAAGAGTLYLIRWTIGGRE